MSKRAILDQIKRLAAASGGKPPGETAFIDQTGIPKSVWWPSLWLNWGDAVEEAGFVRNKFIQATEERVLFEKYIGLVRELGHVPVHGELRRKKKADPSFPTDNVFLRRYGGKEKLLAALMVFCEANPGHEDVMGLCKEHLERTPPDPRLKTDSQSDTVSFGYVYLMKSGPHYKIGRSNSVGRREWELGIKIPIPPKTLHFIKTDDPSGVEAYWHNRFRDKRGEGEWFDLSKEDIAAFKRWARIA